MAFFKEERGHLGRTALSRMSHTSNRKQASNRSLSDTAATCLRCIKDSHASMARLFQQENTDEVREANEAGPPR